MSTTFDWFLFTISKASAHIERAEQMQREYNRFSFGSTDFLHTYEDISSDVCIHNVSTKSINVSYYGSQSYGNRENEDLPQSI